MSNVAIDEDYEEIQIGAQPNDGTGTDLRAGGMIINNNFARTLDNLNKINTALSTIDTDARASSSEMSIVDLPTTQSLEAGKVIAMSLGGEAVYADSMSTRTPVGVSVSASSGGIVRVAVSGIVDANGARAGVTLFLSANGNLVNSPGDNIFQVGVGVDTNRLLIAMNRIIIETSESIDNYLLTQGGTTYYRPLSIRERLQDYNPVYAIYPYVGSSAGGDRWLIKNATGTTASESVLNYANNNNNPTYTNLNDAWNARTMLTYAPLVSLVF